MGKNQAKPEPSAAAKPPPSSVSNRRKIKNYGKNPARLAVFSVVVCLLTIGAVAWLVYPQTAASTHWRQVQRAIDDCDFASALRHLEECLKVWPQSAETQFLMARTCRRAGDFDQARHYLQEAKRLNWVQHQIQLEFLLMSPGGDGSAGGTRLARILARRQGG